MSEPVVLAVDAGGSSIKSALVEANARIVGGIALDAIESKASADQILNTLGKRAPLLGAAILYF